jgi:hypothetical protein
MDDDELPSSGLSGWAGFQLGQMYAEHRRSSAETVAALLHGRRAATAQQIQHAQDRALAVENAQLRQELTDYKRNYAELDAWARRAERQIAQLLKERGE